MDANDVLENVLNFISSTFSTDNILDHLGINAGQAANGQVIGRKNTFEQFGTNIIGMPAGFDANGAIPPIYSDSLPNNPQWTQSLPGLGRLHFQPPKEVIEGDTNEFKWMHDRLYPNPGLKKEF